MTIELSKELKLLFEIAKIDCPDERLVEITWKAGQFGVLPGPHAGKKSFDLMNTGDGGGRFWNKKYSELHCDGLFDMMDMCEYESVDIGPYIKTRGVVTDDFRWDGKTILEDMGVTPRAILFCGKSKDSYHINLELSRGYHNECIFYDKWPTFPTELDYMRAIIAIGRKAFSDELMHVDHEPRQELYRASWDKGFDFLKKK